MPFTPGAVINHPIPLKRSGGEPVGDVEVYSCAEELYHTRDRALYILALPSIGVEVDVRVMSERVRLAARDPIIMTGDGANRLQEPQPGVWRCDHAVLPGTVLVVSWEPVAEVGRV